MAPKLDKLYNFTYFITFSLILVHDFGCIRCEDHTKTQKDEQINTYICVKFGAILVF